MQFSGLFNLRNGIRFTQMPKEDPDSQHDDDEKLLPYNENYPQRSEGRWLLLAYFISIIGIAIFSSAGGYYLGRNAQGGPGPDPVFEDWSKSSSSSGIGTSSGCIQQASHDKYTAGLLVPAGDIDGHLIWNGTFSHLQPSPQSYLEAWRGLFPLHNTVGGIVQHPTLAPNGSALAVFHQLHCLMNLQNTLYQAIAEPGSRNWTAIPYHTEQCIDYLTQGILCNADTNLEPIDPSLYGHNTSIPRKCRDIKSVYDFVRRWQIQMTSEQLEVVLHAHRMLEQTVYISGHDSDHL